MRAPRRGFNLVGLVFMFLLMLVVGGAVSRFARQSGRSGHWFLLSQSAYALASSSLKEAMATLEEQNSPADPGPLQDLLASMVAGAPSGETVLFAGSTGLPPSLQVQVDRLAADDYLAELTVTLRAKDQGPLLAEAVGGIPPDPRERKGRLILDCRAGVTNALGTTVARTIRMERWYKVLGARPALVGRFVLMVEESPDQEVNDVGVEVQRRSVTSPGGDGQLEAGSRRPLVVVPGVTARQIDENSYALERGTLAAAVGGDEAFLDKQGWIYLGGAGSGQPWELRLQHGLGDTGESFQLDGHLRFAFFRMDPSLDRTFRSAIEARLRTVSRCQPDLMGAAHGLRYQDHGWVGNWELIGIQSSRSVQQAGTRSRFVVPGEAGRSSLLRLWGTPQEVSPTLVFGPVVASFMRKAFVSVGLANCPQAGTQLLPVFFPGEDPPRAASVLAAGFGSFLATHGSQLPRRRAYLVGLEQVLDVGVSGRYNSLGTLMPSALGGPAPPGPTHFSSTLIPSLPPLPSGGGLGEDVVRPLFQGDLAIPQLFQGNLAAGLPAFLTVLGKRLAYQVTPEGREASLARVLTSDAGAPALRVPGAIHFTGPDELVLPRIDRILEGGVLVADGPIRITGDLLRGGGEVVTLVSLGGDIRVEGASRVEAALLAPTGMVRFPGGDCTFRGMLGGRRLDLGGIRTQALRLEYDPDLDPLGAPGGPYRVYYGSGPEGAKLAVFGGGSS